MNMNTGIKACENLKTVNFVGNIIPQIWYKIFVKKDLKFPKPHLLAINILSDIVYWYRPVEVRDEATGQVIGYKKKFKSDMLQRSYGQIAEQFGCSERQAKEAIVFLENMKVIKRNFRSITSGGIVCNNILFIELFVDKLAELTYPKNECETEYSPAQNTEQGVCTDLYTGVSKSEGGCVQILSHPHTDIVTPPYRFCHTNTKTSSETSSETSSSSYSPTENKEPKQPQNDDDDITKGEVSEILKSIKIGKLEHRDMIAPISSLIADMLYTGKIGQKKYGQTEIKKLLKSLTLGDIDTIIDRYTEKAEKGEIRNPDNFIKSCLLSAGKAEELAKLAKKSGSDGIHCGNPSFDVDEYVRLSMMRMDGE